MTAAERMKRYRRRRAEGRSIVPIEVSEELADVLVQTGHLRPELSDNPTALRRALERMLSRLVAVDIEGS